MIPYVVGLNHERAALDLRERLALTTEKRQALGRDLRTAVGEVVVLCTCNRSEIMGLACDENAVTHASALLAQAGSFDEQQARDLFYCLRGPEAVEHLYRVAAGLESMVLGEPQILGQVKTAFDESFEAKLAGKQLQQVYQHMLETVKRARHESQVGFGQVSVSSLAVQLARDIFERLSDKTVALVGAGEMAELAAEHFVAANARLVVVNRSTERGQGLATRFSGSYRPWQHLAETVRGADIVLCSTASREPVLTHELVGEATRKRRRPLFLIDIAIPRDIEQAVSRLPEVYVYNLDDLQALVAANLQQRQECAAVASRMIRQALAQGGPLTVDVVGPVISSLRSRVNGISDDELERLFRKHPGWSEREREAVRQAVGRITNKVLHDPIIALRKTNHEPAQKSTLLLNFKRFFNLEE